MWFKVIVELLTPVMSIEFPLFFILLAERLPFTPSVTVYAARITRSITTNTSTTIAKCQSSNRYSDKL